MKYFSTNKHLPDGYQHGHSFSEALLMGIAPDGGLFMPEKLPFFALDILQEFKQYSYAQIAQKVLASLIGSDEKLCDELYNIVNEAYNFDIPIEKINPQLYIARLDQGPTASFKDFAARFMARAIRCVLPENQKLTILVATSGDTGSAVGAAFKGIKGVKVYILYPKHEVSNIQEQQLIRIGDNVQAIAIDGKFDDCQQLVKQAFADKSLQGLHLSSANSINVGRILPQIVYYFYIWSRVAVQNNGINFIVPSGNLGNSLGAELARKMGLPINQLFIATNANKAVPVFFENGIYQKISPSIEAISNAMNVGNPSNLARYFDLYGGTLDKDGITHQQPNLAAMREHIVSESVSDEETISTMHYFYEHYRCLLEPHGAVGAAVYRRHANRLGNEVSVLLETAHPAKFPEIIQQELHISHEMPVSLQQLMEQKANKIDLPNDYNLFKKLIAI